MKQVFSNQGRQELNILAKVASINLPTFPEPRGTLTVVESGHSIPFSIARIFYIYGLNNDCERGAHAHRESEQALIAISGSFSLSLSNGHETKTFAMNDPSRAVHVPPMIWARISNFSAGAICLVLTNTLYDPADYIRNWDEFVQAAG